MTLPPRIEHLKPVDGNDNPPSPEFEGLLSTETEMVVSLVTRNRVFFRNPMVLEPHMMTRTKWIEMGRPACVRVKVWPVYPNGQGWWA
jgi:hypothetical protein